MSILKNSINKYPIEKVIIDNRPKRKINGIITKRIKNSLTLTGKE